MTNHAHLLLLAPSVKVLSKAMQALHVAYVMFFNRRHERRGHLFQDRFSSWVVENEHHLFLTKQYIEENPVRANLVSVKGDYPWSNAYRDGPSITIEEIMG